MKKKFRPPLTLGALMNLQDEELLERYRMGEEKARDVLAVRYFNMRDKLWLRVFPEAAFILDAWDMNECLFNAYLKAEKKYVAKRGSKFLTYVCSILKIQAMEALRQYERNRMLIEALPTDMCFGDDDDGDSRAFASENLVGTRNEPVEAYNYNELCDEINNAPLPDDNEYRKAIALIYKGYKTSEVEKIMNKGGRTLRRRAQAVREHVMEWMAEQDEAVRGFGKEKLDNTCDDLKSPEDR